jgi:hypothetical protein
MDQVDLSELFTTRVEANDFLSRLTTLSESLFKTSFNLEKELVDQFGVNKSDRIIAILRQNNINPESTPAVKDFLFILMSKISSFPVLTLTIAFEPTGQTLKNLSEWFFINMHKQMLFDIHVDRSVIAGAHITYNGKFFDFSIKSTFEKTLQAYMERLAHPNAHIVPKPVMPQTVNQPIQQTQPATQPPAFQPAPPAQTTVQQPITQPVHQNINDMSMVKQ